MDGPKHVVRAAALLLLSLFAAARCAQAVEFEGEAEPPVGDSILWYPRPAADRSEAIPLGNGRIGTLIDGGVEEERIEVSESTLWSPPGKQPSADQVKKDLDAVRALLAAGKAEEAEAAARKIEGAATIGRPLSSIATIVIRGAGWGKVSGYRRSLNLRASLASSEFHGSGSFIKREAFVSGDTDALVIRWESSRGQSINAEIVLENPAGQPGDSVGWTQLRVEGEAGIDPVQQKPLRYSVLLLGMVSGGALDNSHQKIKIVGASSFSLIVAVEAGFDKRPRIEGDKRILALAMKDFDALGYGNLSDRRSLVDRVDLQLGAPRSGSTGARMNAFKAGAEDPALESLFFQAARYLMISASHSTIPPMTSKGVWPGQDGHETSPYNLAGAFPLAYEFAGPASLLECMAPVDELLAPLAISGKDFVSGAYGLGAWGAFGAADRWGTTAPVGAAGLWPFGGAWLARLSLDRLAFQGTDAAEWARFRKGAGRAFALPAKAAHEALMGRPYAAPTRCVEGLWIESPERFPLGAPWSLDHALAADGARGVREMAAAVGDVELEDGAAGWKLDESEWIDATTGRLAARAEEIEAADGAPIGRLYALYPGRVITRRGTRALAKAAASSLEARAALGDRDTPLGRAWAVPLWARLGEGERAHDALRRFFSQDLGVNLSFSGPNQEIDATLLAAAGMAEMLIQSHAGEIELLPALPKAWPEGRVSGLGARGGFSVMIEWKSGAIARAMLFSAQGNPARVRAPGLERVMNGDKSVPAQSPQPGVLTFATEKGAAYLMLPSER